VGSWGLETCTIQVKDIYHEEYELLEEGEHRFRLPCNTGSQDRSGACNVHHIP
jgi:hypothetical protein